MCWLLFPLAGFTQDGGAVYFEQGKKLYGQGDYTQASDLFRQAVSKVPTSTAYRYFLAVTLFQTHHLVDATEEFEKIIALRPYTEEAQLSKQALIDIHHKIYHKRSLSSKLANRQMLGSQKSPVTLENTKEYGDNYIKKVTDKGNVIHWNLAKMPLKIYIETDNRKLEHFDKNFPRAVAEGLDVWVNIFKGKISYTLVKDRAGADIKFNWRDTLDTKTIEVNKETAYTAGVTSPEYTGKQMYAMSVIISLVDPTGKPHNYKQIKSVAAHEFGHALGILGHSDKEDDIMYPKTHDNAKLSQRDINTIKLLYDLAPDISNFDKTTPAEKPAEDKVEFKESVLGVKSKRILDEIKELQANLKETPDNFITHVNIGSLYSEINDLKNAEYHFKKAISLNPKNEIAHSNLGNIYNAMGKQWEAYKEYKAAVKIDPSKPKPYLELAKISFDLKQPRESKEYLEKYKQLSPKAQDDPVVIELTNKMNQPSDQSQK